MQYAKLDEAILEAIRHRRSPLYCGRVSGEARRIEDATGRSDFRIIDGRLQALRKQGRIVHLTKRENGGSGGWKVVESKGVNKP